MKVMRVVVRSGRTAAFHQEGSLGPKILLVVALTSLLLLGLAMPGSERRPCPTPTGNPTFKLGTALPGSRHGPEWYFRSGQWRADAKTLVALVRFLLEPDRCLQTNVVPVQA